MFIHCPFCGIEINTEDRSCHRECPIGKNCRMICCPNCRYSFVIPKSSILELLKRLFGRSEGK